MRKANLSAAAAALATDLEAGGAAGNTDVTHPQEELLPGCAPHITIVRPGRLGDVTLVLPAVQALIAQGTPVSWMIGTDAYRLVDQVQGIDWVVLRGGVNAGRQIATRLPGNTRFVMLEIRPPPEGAMAVCRSSNLQHALRMDIWNDGSHAFERFWWSVLRRQPRPGERARYGIPIAHRRRQPLFLLNPCPSHPERDVPPALYAEALQAASDLGLETVIVHGGTRRETAIVDYLVRQTDARGQMCTLPELLELMTAASCLMTPDTGPAHFAGITGTPCIGIYTKNTLEQWGPYWSRHWSVEHAGNWRSTFYQVHERLQALHRAGYPRCGGEGALIPTPPVSYKNDPATL